MELRDSLRCENFKWYLANVYPEQKVPHKLSAGWGQISQAKSPTEKKCVGWWLKENRNLFEYCS